MGAKLIFASKSTLAFGFFGKISGKSISVYSNGKIVERKYVLGDNKPIEEHIVGYNKEMAECIEDIIESYMGELEKVPNELKNGSLEGTHDCIKFLGKSICGWNIRKSDIEEIKEINSSYIDLVKGFRNIYKLWEATPGA